MCQRKKEKERRRIRIIRIIIIIIRNGAKTISLPTLFGRLNKMQSILTSLMPRKSNNLKSMLNNSSLFKFLF